ncbi:hypothetical protein [Paraburkholderia unamae]|uniref:DUF2964 family protein n=1 Tax=Paraburkholderia unamae TaxID=219649 RepID=A0ABX5KLN2_9BURK|nr:hypothetical protein [Paraburkholderia unamae]PVX80023.1 hypothetical protein C7402_112210 [Paraburkholderia unamae]
MVKPYMPPTQVDASAAERLNTVVMLASGFGLVAIAACLVFAHDWVELMEYTILILCSVIAVIICAVAAHHIGGRFGG